MKKEQKKERKTIGQIIRENYDVIIYGTTALVIFGCGASWLWHVRRNTTELGKLVIPNGKCYEYFRQFGEDYLSGESKIGDLGDFMKKLIDEGRFKPENRIFFMATTDNEI